MTTSNSAASVGTSSAEQEQNAIRVAVPGTGVRDSEIEGIVYEGRGETTVTGYAYVETAHLLLKDGWAYSDLDVPPEDLNVDAARRLYPASWHKRRAQGKDIYLQDERTEQWSRSSATYIRPLEPQLNLNLIHRNSVRFGGMGSFNTNIQAGWDLRARTRSSCRNGSRSGGRRIFQQHLFDS